ncbi:MAG: hypothetical protein RR992_06760 [Clostridiales bacterium]
MVTENNKVCEDFSQWQTGMWRVMSASWAASYLSYGLNAAEITVLAEYYSLISSCLVNFAVAKGEALIIDEKL